MFKIGEFSKLVQVPVTTLRYYDQVGLLKPVEVDRFTGYRYYTASQIPPVHRILALKGLGFSLEQIGAALAEGVTSEQMRGMLRLRHAQIEREEQPAYDVVLKQVEPLLVALIRDILPTHGAVGALFAEVYAALGPHPGEPGQTLVLWYDTEFKERDVDGAAAFILRCRVPDSGRMKVQELPAATMAATIHVSLWFNS